MASPADDFDASAADVVHVRDVCADAAPAKKIRRIPEQVCAVPCPVFEASAEDLLNFDAVINHLWHEKQAWRSGIAKVVLKPCARRLIDPAGLGITWDQSVARSFWAQFSEAPISRVLNQCVVKVDNGLFRVEKETELLIPGEETVASFFGKALDKGVVHPKSLGVLHGEDLLKQMPTTVFTSENQPSLHDKNALCLEERKEFWASLEALEIGGRSDEISYVTELNVEPVEESELEARFGQEGPMRKEVSTLFLCFHCL